MEREGEVRRVGAEGERRTMWGQQAERQRKRDGQWTGGRCGGSG